MRYFEYKDEKSDKFWQIDVQGCDVITCYGKIGSAGRESTKSHDTEEKAQASVEKLIAQKVKKGYVENASSGSASTDTEGPKNASKTLQKTENVATKGAEKLETNIVESDTVESVSTSTIQDATPSHITEADFCVEPSEQLVWDSQFDELLHPMRGIYTPEPEPLTLKLLPKASRDALIAYAHAEIWQSFFDTIAQLKKDKSPANENVIAQRFDAKQLQKLIFQTKKTKASMFTWMVQTLLYDAGLVQTLTWVLEGLNHYEQYDYSEANTLNGLTILRKHVALVDENTYDSLKEIAKPYRDKNAHNVMAFIFASEQAWKSTLHVGYSSTGDTGLDIGIFYHPQEIKKLVGDYHLDVESEQALMCIRVFGLAFIPVINGAFDYLNRNNNAKERLKNQEVLSAIASYLPMLDSTQTLEQVLAYSEHGCIVSVLDAFIEKYPRYTLNLLATEKDSLDGKTALACKPNIKPWIITKLSQHPEWHTHIANCCDKSIVRLLESSKKALAKQGEIANINELPEIFQAPPWQITPEKPKKPNLTLSMPNHLNCDDAVHWHAGQKERFSAQYDASEKHHDLTRNVTAILRYHYGFSDGKVRKFKKAHHHWSPNEYKVFCLGIKEDHVTDIANDMVMQPEYFSIPNPDLYDPLGGFLEVMPWLPVDIALPIWNAASPKYWDYYQDELALYLMSQFGVQGLDGYITLLASASPELWEYVIHFESVKLIPIMLDAYHKKTRRKLALTWFKTYQALAIPALLSAIFSGKDKTYTKKQKDTALTIIKYLKETCDIQADLSSLYPDLAEKERSAIQAYVYQPSWKDVPKKIPAAGLLPTFLNIDSLPQLTLADTNHVLAKAQVITMCEILALCEHNLPYHGVTFLKQLSADSLAEFSWALFQAWETANLPSDYKWMYSQLGLLADDAVLSKFVPILKKMPGYTSHQNAVMGVEILAHIGSDMALMYLNGLAQTRKFKAFKETAKNQINRIAETRNLSLAQLADRLAPHLGLDKRGQMLLDFGSRTFIASFDEHLKPVLKNEDGKHLKNLPKPNQKDDADKAEDAIKTFKQLKKDVRAVASIELKRLEQAMCLQRRWTFDEFEVMFVQHPLIRHISQRLIWGIYDANNKLTHSFRIAEDLSFTDANDDDIDIKSLIKKQANTPETQCIGIAHVLELSQSQQQAFGSLFSDYEILQPFEQLGRQTFALTDEERKQNSITRFDQHYDARSIMGLTNIGRERGEVLDAGGVGSMQKTLENGVTAYLALSPGLTVGMGLEYHEPQSIVEIVLSENWYAENRSFDSISDIIISELIRDMQGINPLDD